MGVSCLASLDDECFKVGGPGKIVIGENTFFGAWELGR